MTDEADHEFRNFRQGVYERLNTLERDVSGLIASQNAFQSSISSAVARLTERSDAPTNWVGIGGLIFVAFGFNLTVMTIALDGVKDDIGEAKRITTARAQLVYSAPERLNALELRTEDLRGRQIDLIGDINWQRGELQALKERVADIDNMGSRRWNSRGSPD